MTDEPDRRRSGTPSGRSPNRTRTDPPSWSRPTTDELVERLSFGTATLLLIWLFIVGAGTALLAAWVVSALVLASDSGPEQLFERVRLLRRPVRRHRPHRPVAHRPRPRPWLAVVRATAIRIGLFMSVLTILFGGS